MEQPHVEQRSTFRLDVQLHELLTKPQERTIPLPPLGKPQTFPDQVLPLLPELLGPLEGPSKAQECRRRG